MDPKRVWKGAWRWYHEDMLDCCFPLELVQQNGITLDQFICLALCNYLDLNVVRMNEPNISVQDFRKLVQEICSGSGKLLVCSYSRRGLGQTGDGHFSPIGKFLQIFLYNPCGVLQIFGIFTFFVEISALIFFRAPSTKVQNSVLIFAQFRANFWLKQHFCMVFAKYKV